MTTRRRRRDPNSWTIVKLPERALSDVVLELATPLLAKLGAAATVDERRVVVGLAVTFWNANVLASKQWEYPRTKDLNALKQRMRAPEDRATLGLLTERWREHWLDPRLVESWTYDVDATGEAHFVCIMALPDGVKAMVPPAIEKRIAIAGKFLDEVRIGIGSNTSLGFPVERHSGVVHDDGSVTIHTMMPVALQLFADGSLPPVGRGRVQIQIGVRELGAMELCNVQCSGALSRHEGTALAFRPLTAAAPA